MPEATPIAVPLVPRRDADGEYYTVAEPGESTVAVPWATAVHARILPLGRAEEVLRAAAHGTVRVDAASPMPDDPTTTVPARTRAGAVIIRDGRMLLIHHDDGDERYEIPGGGLEPGETPEQALVREIREETGLTAVPGREIARVWRTAVRAGGVLLDHYFLVEAEGEIGPHETLDLDGGWPVWVPVADLPTTPAWPRRVRWRIAHWYAHGWPGSAVWLGEARGDFAEPCTW